MKRAPVNTTNESALEQRYSNPASDLFPETLPPVIPASWPTIGTREDEALQALLHGPQNQADYSNGWRLGAYIKSLQYKRWAFIKRSIEKAGCRRPIAEYRLDHSDPATSAALMAKGVQA